MRVIGVDGPTLVDAAAIQSASSRLSTRDAVHVASMRRAGLTRIISADAGFDAVEGLARESPAAFVGR